MIDALTQKALRLKELNKLIIKAVATWDIDQLGKYIVEYNETKKQIRTYSFEHPLINLKDITSADARVIIQKIASGESLSVEKSIMGGKIEEFLKGELDEDEIDKIGSELFYSWFSHHEYVVSLYEIGSLTLSCGSIPAHLSVFVNEARHCYTFQQYNAVFSLCRTVLEICIKDLAVVNGILSADSHNVRQMSSRVPDLYDLINQLCDKFGERGNVRKQLHKVRTKTNYIIHGNRVVKRDEAKEVLRETLSAIHQLFELESPRKKVR
jgi:hypothetical protein